MNCIECNKEMGEHEEEFPYCSRLCCDLHMWRAGVKEGFLMLFEEAQTNFNRSPFAKKQGSEGWFKLLEGELKELHEAIASNNPTRVEEESGDVFWNLMHLLFALQREGRSYTPLLFTAISKKMHERKPWIYDGSEITFTAEQEAAQFKANKERLKDRS
jgi:NTP pyrophosphatase (non-canonical NTP hydrolase)